jgi:hypothetical protein
MTINNLKFFITLLIAGLAVACVNAENPYDLEAPAHLQLDGHLVGRITLASHNFDAQPIELQLLDQTGTPVQNDDGPIFIQTRSSDTALPENFEDDGLGAAGTFALALPPSEAPYISSHGPNRRRTSRQYFCCDT